MYKDITSLSCYVNSYNVTTKKLPTGMMKIYSIFTHIYTHTAQRH